MSTVKKGRWVKPERVVRNDYTYIPWDFPVKTDKHLLHNRPDTMLINYKKQTGLIIEIAEPRNEDTQDKKLEKINKCQSLKIELEQLLKVNIMVIPVVVGALDAIADRLPGWLAEIPETMSNVELQKSLGLRIKPPMM